jgi:hypothetical protein
MGLCLKKSGFICMLPIFYNLWKIVFFELQALLIPMLLETLRLSTMSYLVDIIIFISCFLLLVSIFSPYEFWIMCPKHQEYAEICALYHNHHSCGHICLSIFLAFLHQFLIHDIFVDIIYLNLIFFFSVRESKSCRAWEYRMECLR